MLRSVINKRLVQAAIIPFLNNSYDKLSDEQLKEITPQRVGIDKVKDFFYDETGEISKEIQSIITSTTVSLVSGFLIGGIFKTRQVAENFVRDNEATLFRNQFEAKRDLQYKIAVALFQGGGSFALKLGKFIFLFSTTATVLQSYKGKFDPSQHLIAGAVTGCIYKMNMGLKGAIAGGIIGGILGAISGNLVLLILYLTGTDLGYLFEANNKWMQTRRERIQKNISSMKEEHMLIKQMCDENQNIRKIVYGDKEEKK